MLTIAFRAVPKGQATVESGKSAGSVRRLGRGVAAVTGVALAVSLFAASGAEAQNCGPLTAGGPFGGGSFVGLFGSAVSAGATISSAITAANTAFLTQSTAFVSAPADPQPGQEGGGVWVRGVGGELDLKSSSNVSGTLTFPAGTASGATTCATKFHESYGGMQVGSDVAKLNLDGWNVHLGTTAGAIWSSGDIVGGSPNAPFLAATTTQVPFNTTAQSPFVGTYAVATKGNFFIDGLVRYDNYGLNLNSPANSIFNQRDDAHGISVSGSAGYNYQVPNSKWFVEPSAGLIWSRTTVGALNLNTPAAPGVAGFSGTAQINDITSIIGRVGLRVGTTMDAGNIVYQPFVSASVWHDFGGNITGTYQSCANCIFFGGLPGVTTGAISTTNVGTFGQYSVGISAQLVHTGWLGFARLDYRDGSNLQSLSGTAGIRYQFTPDMVVASNGLPVKAPVFKAPVMTPVSWTGFYVGGIAGADYGRSEYIVPGLAGADIHPSGVLLGGTVGYNYQVGKYVLGIEADDSWTNYRGSAACSPLITGLTPLGASAPSPAFFQTTCHDNINWLATVTGRAGYLFGPRTLTYVKAGVAFGNETWSATCNLGPLNNTVLPGTGVQSCNNPAGALLNSISASDIRVGATIGYGVEFALSQNWSAKGEWDWMDFGSKTLIASDGTAFTAKQWSVSEVKVGLNYHFNH